jgi:hypothetical protein
MKFTHKKTVFDTDKDTLILSMTWPPKFTDYKGKTTPLHESMESLYRTAQGRHYRVIQYRTGETTVEPITPSRAKQRQEQLKGFLPHIPGAKLVFGDFTPANMN